MKIRIYFVSNSSSSSFVCDISGETSEYYDCSLEDVGMYQCINGHIFLEEYLEKNEEIEILEKNNEEFRYSVPERFCPICSFKYIMERDLVKYIQSVYQIKQEEVYDYMKSKSKRLRKIRNSYWFEVLEIKEDISKFKLTDKIKKEFKNYEEFRKNIL